MYEATIDPVRSQFFLHSVLRKASGKPPEINPVECLILIET